MSQLDLAAAAEVSARHISFLETGRSEPSRDMVLRLGATIDVPLRDQNALLQAAGYAAVFREALDPEELPGPIDDALRRMADKHEPYPLVVMNRVYDILRLNHGARALFARAGLMVPARPNALGLVFDPEGMRPLVEGWEEVARQALSRVQRELLQRPGDRELSALFARLLAYPGVPDDWRTPDLDQASEPVLAFRLRLDGELLRFLTTLTVFNAPQNVEVEELCIESYFPLDEVTERFCATLR